jgi:sugar lactone lactonase YvrE
MNSPLGIAIDSSGSIYAANYLDSTVTKFNSQGVYTRTIGYLTSLKYPSGIAVDSSNNIYVANYHQSKISKFSSSGSLISTIDPNSYYLNFPQGLAIDSSGNIYAANLVTRNIVKFDRNGNFLTSWVTGYGTAAGVPNYIAFGPVSVPEPSTYILATIAASTLAYVAHRRKK